MNKYELTVEVEHFIPPDVLVEHLAVCLKSLNFTGKVDIKMARNHPFEGPVVFDDEPRLEDSFPEDPFPLTTQVIDRIKETRRHGND